MWSPRCIDSGRMRCLLLAAGLLALAGCAGGPGSGDAGLAADAAEAREVPPRARTLYEQAVASLAAGDDIDAELRFQEFLLQYPDFAGSYVNLAIIQAARGNDDEAENYLAQALMLDPEHAVALNQLGVLYRSQGKFGEAEAAYLKAVTASPDYALAHYNLGVLNDLYLQRLDAALRHYERYQEITGDDGRVTKWIADLERRIDVAQRTANVTE